MKLCALKAELKRWNIEEFGIEEDQLKKAEEELHALDLMAESRVLEAHEIALRREVRSLVWKLRRRKDWIWFQKSKLNWAQCGDKNTRYFHIIASKRHSKNLIDSVVVDGVCVEDPGLVRQEVLRHFSKVFSEEWKSRPKLMGDFISVRRSQVEEVLEAKFIMEEIWAAVQDCDGNKAPGPDKFNMTCIQKCWKFMKNDVFQFLQDFYTNRKLVKGLNSSFISLIQKKMCPKGLVDYRQGFKKRPQPLRNAVT
ncbi:unnamed protein product [Camellia sinensis]